MALDPAPLLAGVALGVSLAAPPGPVTALMLNEAVRRGAWSGARVGLGATTADLCYLGLAFAGAVAVLRDRPQVLALLAMVGAAVLVYFAWGAWRSARRPAEEAAGRAGFRDGFLAALTSPFNLAWWVGPGAVLVATTTPLLPAGMFVGIVGWVLLFSHGVAALGARVAGLQRGVAYASVVVLGAFALWVGWRGAQLLGFA